MSYPLENVASGALTVLALALAFVAFRAWHATKSRKVLLLATGFALFLAKGILVSVGLFLWSDWAQRVLLPSLVLDLAVLGLFWAAVLKQDRR